jgi:hypothetical protein
MPLNPLKDKRIGPQWRGALLAAGNFRHRRVCNLGFLTNVEALAVYLHNNPGATTGAALDYLYEASGRLGKRPPGWGCWYFSSTRGLGGMGGILWKKGPNRLSGWTLTPRGEERLSNLE